MTNHNKAIQVVVLPYHGQGHLNTMVQFAKRLAWKGLQVTIATSKSTTQKMSTSLSLRESITMESVYDDTNDFKIRFKERMDKFETEGASNLAHILVSKKKRALNNKCLLVYYGGLQWALVVAHQYKVAAAAFFTQGNASIVCYHCLHLESQGKVIEPELPVVLPSPDLIVQKLPIAFIRNTPTSTSHDETSNKKEFVPLVSWLLKDFATFVQADFVLVNSFDKLEQEVIDWMSNICNVKTIGPTLPSAYLDKRIENDIDYGFNQYKPTDQDCISWLNTKPAGSVVYVAFGSVATLSAEQTVEVAEALKLNPGSFMWVVRETEHEKLPDNFVLETSGKGLVLPWCPQLDILAHEAVGCFVSHCGWNSTIEALSLGVPVLAMPQFLDQVVDAHFVDQVWGVGIAPKENEEGLITRQEISRCLGELMSGERSKAIKEKAAMWGASAKEASDEGGSSNRHIDEIIQWVASSEV